jgi:hypothetical protein
LEADFSEDLEELFPAGVAVGIILIRSLICRPPQADGSNNERNKTLDRSQPAPAANPSGEAAHYTLFFVARLDASLPANLDFFMPPGPVGFDENDRNFSQR